MKISFGIMYAFINPAACASKPEGCFHPTKVMQFRKSLTRDLGINMNQLSYDQLRNAIRNQYVCNNDLCIFCGSNFVYTIRQN